MDNHKEIWNKVDGLRELSWKQQAELEVLKDNLNRERDAKAKTAVTIRWGAGILIGLIFSVFGYAWNMSQDFAKIQQELIDTKEKLEKTIEVLELVSGDVVTVQTQVDDVKTDLANNYERKE